MNVIPYISSKKKYDTVHQKLPSSPIIQTVSKYRESRRTIPCLKRLYCIINKLISLPIIRPRFYGRPLPWAKLLRSLLHGIS